MRAVNRLPQVAGEDPPGYTQCNPHREANGEPMGVNPTEPDPNNPSDAAHPRAESLTWVIETPRVERWFRSLVQNSSDVVTLLDADGTIRYQSPSIERILGYDPEELVGDNAFHYVYPEDLGRVETAFAEGLKDPRRRPSAEYRFRHKDGSWVWLESVGTNLLGDSGVGKYVVNSRDVTERKAGEEELNALRREYEELVGSVEAIIWKGEAQTLRFTFVSDQAEAILGYPAQRWTEEPSFWIDHIHPEDREWAVSFCRRAVAENEDHDFEYRMLSADGDVVWLRDIVRVGVKDGVPKQLFGVMVDITKRKEAEEALKESEGRYRALMEQSVEAIYLFDAETKRVLEANAAFESLMGYAEEELLGMRIYDFIAHDPDDIDRHIMRSLKEKQRQIGERRYRRKDGSVILVDTSASVISYGGRMALCAVSRDVTERREAEEAVRKSEARLAEAQRLAHLGGWEWDVRTDEISWSDEVYRIYGFAPQSFVPSFERFMEIVHPDDRGRIEAVIDDALNDHSPYDLKHRIVRPDGEVRWAHRRAKVVRGEGGVPLRMVGTVHDITERKALEERLEHQALHDALTDLPNRQLLVDRLGHALARTERRKDSGVAVLFMDLDGFKIVNDSLGHDIGDMLLVAVAERLKGCLRPEDTLARFGGDEFIVLLEEVEGADDALRVTQRITEELQRPFVLDGKELVVRLSIGVALGEAQTKSPEELLRDADTAMYRAKDDAADYRVFDPGMHERALRRMELENDLREAVQRGEFTLYYQPKFRLGQPDRIEGFEALLRWEHPQKGFMLPGEFIPIAEEANLLTPIGAWVMKEACRQAKEWQQRYPSEPPLAMCVNLSAGQVRHPGLLKDVRSALRESDLDPGSLLLEITENTLLKGTELTETVFKELKALGVRLAIDDFGKEYSSLSYLNRLPVDALKIDRLFLESFGEDPSKMLIVEAVVSLAHSLVLEVIGEGVESAEQLELLREMGCDFVQGYHLARPMPAKEVPRFLAE